MAVRTADHCTGGAVTAAGAVVVVVAAILTGCMQQHLPAAPGQAAGLAPKEGFFLNRDADTVSLAYGPPQSDDVRLMLQCQPGKREVEITDGGHRDAKTGGMLVLTSGKMQSAVPVRLEPNQETGGALAVAHATTGLPALEGFRRTGSISVKLDGREYALSATDGEKAEIARFFSACDRK